jgi:hypothetical protein
MNAAELWAQDHERCKLVTGYALGDDDPKRRKLVTGYALGDDRWRQHSWCRDDKGLIETTVKCDKYFGAVLDDVEAIFFWLCQLTAYPAAAKLLEKALTDVFFQMAEAGLMDAKALDNLKSILTKDKIDALTLAHSMKRNAS